MNQEFESLKERIIATVITTVSLCFGLMWVIYDVTKNFLLSKKM